MDSPLLLSESKTSPSTHAAQIAGVIAAANRVILGKDGAVRLAFACLLARGHLLIEDLPGVGKTTLAQTLARLLGLRFSRIQFTSDMLPADIIGISIYDREKNTFRFLPGAIFSQVLLADEINRATPKTQSALLEAMEERQVTVEGETRPLPEPFFVIGTQNPSTQVGTFPLPESQLDRFLLRVELGYPDRAAERELLESGGRRDTLPTLAARLLPSQLPRLQQAVESVHVAPALLDYVQALVEATRTNPRFIHGLSPRAALALLAVARAWAFLAGRRMVMPEDVQAVLPSVARHRLQLADGNGHARAEDIAGLMRSVPVT
jgi:MoxR-like ATPase